MIILGEGDVEGKEFKFEKILILMIHSSIKKVRRGSWEN